MANATPKLTPNEAFMLFADTNDSIYHTGTIAANAGTSVQPVSMANTIPGSPRFITDVYIQMTATLELTIPATAGQATVSQLFPHCLLSAKLELAGVDSTAPGMLELSAWYLDSITRRDGFDPAYSGLGRMASDSSPFGTGATAYQDDENTQFVANNGSTVGLVGGYIISNTGASALVTDFDLVIVFHIQLQEDREKLAGCIPNGSPTQKFVPAYQMNVLVGNNPEVNAFADTGTDAGVTCTLKNTATFNIVYPSLKIDMAPAGFVDPSPQVTVGLQRNIVKGTINFSNAGGSPSYTTINTALLYDKFIVGLVNAKTMIPFDYIGLWKSQANEDYIMEWDVSKNNLWRYYTHVHETLQRYLPVGIGLLSVRLQEGVDPRLLKYSLKAHRWITPDAFLASQVGVPQLGLLSVATRIPAGVTLSGSSYAFVYSYGLKPVSY